MGNDRIDALLNLVLSFPTIIFSILVTVALLYWLLVAIGMADVDAIDVGEVDADLDLDVDLGGILGVLTRFGLDGVPLTIIITFISFFGWFISSVSAFFINPLVPTVLLQLIAGVPMFLLSLYMATLVTGIVIKPLRPIFISSNQEVQKQILGQTAVVRTGKVTKDFGEANLDDGGAGIIVKVRSFKDEEFNRGDRVVLLEHVPEENVYKVVSESDFKG